MTNFELIKNFSFEEMAHFFLTDYATEASNLFCKHCQQTHGGKCYAEVEDLNMCPKSEREVVEYWLNHHPERIEEKELKK